MRPRFAIFLGVVIVALTLVGAWGWFVVIPEAMTRREKEQLASLDASLDTDGDGYTDEEELAYGSNPVDPTFNRGSHGKVLIARQDIPKKTLITDSMVILRFIPGGMNHLGDYQDTLQIVGRFSTVEIRTGDFILDTMLTRNSPTR